MWIDCVFLLLLLFCKATPGQMVGWTIPSAVGTVPLLPMNSADLIWRTCGDDGTQLMAYQAGNIWFFGVPSASTSTQATQSFLTVGPVLHYNKWSAPDAYESLVLASGGTAPGGSSANCSLVGWSWTTGRFRLGFANGTSWYSAQIVTPSSLPLQYQAKAQPDSLVVLRDGRVCALGQAGTVVQPSRSEVPCLNPRTRGTQVLDVDVTHCTTGPEANAPAPTVILDSGRIVCGTWWAEERAFAANASAAERRFHKFNLSDGELALTWAMPGGGVIGYTDSKQTGGRYSVLSSTALGSSRADLSSLLAMNLPALSPGLQLWMPEDRSILVTLMNLRSGNPSSAAQLLRLNLDATQRRGSWVSSSQGEPLVRLPAVFETAINQQGGVLLPLIATRDRIVLTVGTWILSIPSEVITGSLFGADSTIPGDSICVPWPSLQDDPQHCGLCRVSCNGTCMQAKCTSPTYSSSATSFLLTVSHSSSFYNPFPINIVIPDEFFLCVTTSILLWLAYEFVVM